MVGTTSVDDHTAALAHRYDSIVNAASYQIRTDELGSANVGCRMVGTPLCLSQLGRAKTGGSLGNIGGFVKIRDQNID